MPPSRPNIDSLKECLVRLEKLPKQQNTIKDLKKLIYELELAEDPKFECSLKPSIDFSSLISNNNIDITSVSTIINSKSSARNEIKSINNKMSKPLMTRDNLSWPKPKRPKNDSDTQFINVPLYTS